MIYALEVSYTKETLPIIEDLWEFIRLHPISDDYEHESKLEIGKNDELMQFNDFDDFKEWAEEEVDEDPIFMILDVEEKSIYYYEVDPNIKFTRLEGKFTFGEMEKEKEKIAKLKIKEAEKVHKENLIKERDKLAEKMKEISRELNDEEIKETK